MSIPARFAWASSVVLMMALGSLVTGCPSGMCLVKVCKGDMSDCRCSWSTCPSGSDYDTNRETCVCKAGLVSINGACMSPVEANAYCGRGSQYSNYGCVKIACPPGQDLDFETNTCVAKSRVAENMGVPIGPNQQLGCPPGLVLVVENARTASCVPPENTCARDEAWNGRACAKLPTCSPGTILDVQKNTCVAVTTDDDKYTVELEQWTRSSYGPDGGSGTSAFCSAFNKKPATFGVLAGGSIAVRVEVGVIAPTKSVAQARVGASAVVEASRQPVTPQGAQEVQRAADEILRSLIQQGGRADRESARTNVRCLIVNAAAPTAVPATGGI